MKKLLVLLSIGLVGTSFSYSQAIQDANAPSIVDGVRYANEDLKGTARFRAMSGAFGALGGDLSSIQINPAGAAIYNSSSVTLSLGVNNIDSDTRYFNGQNSSSETNVDLNQAGVAFVFDNPNPNSGWGKFTFGFAYDQTGNYDEEWVADGVNTNNRSIADYFLQFANGRRLDGISARSGESISDAYADIGSVFGTGHQQAFLGFESFIINPDVDADNNTSYNSSISGSNFGQRYVYSTRGFNSKLAFNFATSYLDKVYLGLNLNVHVLDYDRITILDESNNNASSTITDVRFGNELYSTGTGFSFQIGGIVKITEELRAGVSYMSPTWYRINDETVQFVNTIGNTGERTSISPNIINVFEEYRLQTPGKLTGSLAYVFGKHGLISFDYDIKDYSNIEYRPSSDALFSELNQEFENLLDTSSSYRIGGEYRYKQFSFRGGYRFEQSPYKNDNLYGDLQGYSLGLGYKFGNYSLDLAFSQAQRDVNQRLYEVGLTDSAAIDSKFTDVVLSLAFNL